MAVSGFLSSCDDGRDQLALVGVEGLQLLDQPVLALEGAGVEDRAAEVVADVGGGRRLVLGPVGLAGRPGQHQVAQALRAGAQRREQDRGDADAGEEGQDQLALRLGDGVAERLVAGDDLDLLDRPGATGGRLGDPDQLVRQRDPAAVGGVDGAGAVAVLVEGLDPHAVGLEALDQRLLAVGEHAVEAELGTGGADDPPGRLGEPDLLRERLPLEGGDHGAAGLLGVRLEDAALGRVGALAVRRAGRWRASRGARPPCRAAARSGGRAGATRRGRRSASTSGTQPQVSPAVGSSRSCGTNRSRPHSSAFSISVISWSTGVRRPWSSIRASSLPATAITSSLPSSRATLIAATPKPARSVTPSAISCKASREGPSDQMGRTAGVWSSASRDMSCGTSPWRHPCY